jgi:hypothetical protein
MKALEKLKAVKSSFQGDAKAQAWIDGLLKIPFGKYNQNEIISFKHNFINKLNKKIFSDHEIDCYIENLDKSNLLVSEWNNYKIEKVKYLKLNKELKKYKANITESISNILKRIFLLSCLRFDY